MSSGKSLHTNPRARASAHSSFLNASAIWRSHEKHEPSIAYLKRGLVLYPQEPGLWNNLGNCHLDTNSLLLAICNYRKALELKPDFGESRISLATCLRELGHINLAYAVLKGRYQPTITEEERQRLLIPLVETILALSSHGSKRIEPKDMDAFIQMVETEVHQYLGSEEPCRAGLMLTQLWLQVDQLDRALLRRNELIKDTHKFQQPEKTNFKLKASFHTTWHTLNWNLGIKLLKKGRLKEDGVLRQRSTCWHHSTTLATFSKKPLLHECLFGEENQYKTNAYYSLVSKALVIR